MPKPAVQLQFEWCVPHSCQDRHHHYSIPFFVRLLCVHIRNVFKRLIIRKRGTFAGKLYCEKNNRFLWRKRPRKGRSVVVHWPTKYTNLTLFLFYSHFYFSASSTAWLLPFEAVLPGIFFRQICLNFSNQLVLIYLFEMQFD